MRALYRPMAGKTDNFRETGVTSDDISAKVATFLRGVKTILNVKNQPRRLQVAHDTVLDLQGFPHGALEASYGDRSSDTLADTMLVEIATDRRANEEVWDYTNFHPVTKPPRAPPRPMLLDVFRQAWSTSGAVR
jgi:hypothetical protein